MKRSLKLPRQFKILPSGAIALSGVECIDMAGVPVYVVAGGNEPVFRLELLFRAGKLYEHQHSAASATAALLTEGTLDKDAHILADALEYYGATVRCYSSPDTLTLSVHGMTRFAVPVLELAQEILLAPAFSEHELVLYQKKKIQRYRLAEGQNEYLANRAFSERIFGASHPYGYTGTPDDVQALTPDTLRRHHGLLGKQGLNVFLAGAMEQGLESEVRNFLGSLGEGIRPRAYPDPPVQTPGAWHVAGPQTHQVSVRIGKQIIHRTHEDYPGLFLLNTILGGYHGSRLVRNLRENKGLTYNIQSSLENLLHATCFVISTDANNASPEIVMREIYRELKKLQTKVVEDPELEMVKNYICGNFLMQIDGPLNVVDTVKPLVLHSLPLSYFEAFLTALRQITPTELRNLAEKYLISSDTIEVTVG